MSMLVNDTSSTVSFPLVPATPTLTDMLGANIEYINARPYQRMPLHAVGLVIGFRHRSNGDLELKVQNSTTCRERWINAETDFVRYSR